MFEGAFEAVEGVLEELLEAVLKAHREKASKGVEGAFEGASRECF
jgi:hypothetical protein